MTKATAEYLDAEDSFGRWLAECCARDPMAHETTRDLYAAWTAWAERSGMSAGSEPKFRGALKARRLCLQSASRGRGEPVSKAFGFSDETTPTISGSEADIDAPKHTNARKTPFRNDSFAVCEGT